MRWSIYIFAFVVVAVFIINVAVPVFISAVEQKPLSDEDTRDILLTMIVAGGSGFAFFLLLGITNKIRKGEEK